MSTEFAQACDFKFATLKWFDPVPGLGPSPELCHDRGLALPHPWDRRGLALQHPWDCVGVTVALGVSSVIVPGLHATGVREHPCGHWPHQQTPE